MDGHPTPHLRGGQNPAYRSTHRRSDVWPSVFATLRTEGGVSSTRQGTWSYLVTRLGSSRHVSFEVVASALAVLKLLCIIFVVPPAITAPNGRTAIEPKIPHGPDLRSNASAALALGTRMLLCVVTVPHAKCTNSPSAHRSRVAGRCGRLLSWFVDGGHVMRTCSLAPTAFLKPSVHTAG